jgi:hypothetical protein
MNFIFSKKNSTYLIIIYLLQVSTLLSQSESGSNNFTDSSSHVKSLTLKQKQQKIYKNDIDYFKVAGITGVTGGAFWWLHNYQANAWWKNQRGKFHFAEDWAYSLSADKCGHFFDGDLIQTLYQGAFEWAGFKKTTAMWMGVGFSIACMTDTEIEDGFATSWGFSWGDEMANVSGALYPVAQHYWDPLKNFNFKWSYYPSDELRNGAKDGVFLDDYNGQTIWLSVDVHNMLPKKAKKYWPGIFNIVFGYGVDFYTDFNRRYQNWYVGLDLNWEKIIPGNSRFMIWFKNVINHFRFFPLPVMRFNMHQVKYTVNF